VIRKQIAEHNWRRCLSCGIENIQTPVYRISVTANEKETPFHSQSLFLCVNCMKELSEIPDHL